MPIEDNIRQQLDLEMTTMNELSRIRNTGRNDTCICGSGNKYKKCCMSFVEKRFIVRKNFINKRNRI